MSRICFLAAFEKRKQAYFWWFHPNKRGQCGLGTIFFEDPSKMFKAGFVAMRSIRSCPQGAAKSKARIPRSRRF